MEALTSLLLVVGTFLVGLVARTALVVLLLGVVWMATVAVWAPCQGAGWLWNRINGPRAA